MHVYMYIVHCNHNFKPLFLDMNFRACKYMSKYVAHMPSMRSAYYETHH